MFGAPLNVLLGFVVTAPLAGWIFELLKMRQQRDRACGIYALIGLSATSYFVYELYREVTARHTVVITLLQQYLPPLGASLEIDMLGIFMSSLIIGLGIGACVYSIRYMEHDTGLVTYYTLLLALVAGMIGVVYAGDLFTLFIFWELMCLASYTLVAFRKERWAPIEAGFKFLVMSSFGNVTVLFAMSLLYGMTGTLNLATLSLSLRDAATSIWILIAMSLVSVGMIISGSLAHRMAAIVPPQALEGLGGRSDGRTALDATAALPCDAGRIARAASEAWMRGRSELVDAAERAAVECAARRFRTLEPLHVLAQISPMIGLFGTVYGMIVAFQAVAASGGQADPALLAGGIGTALVTTFWGLVVAVPALLAYALLRNRVDAALASALESVLHAARDAPNMESAAR